MEIAGLKVSPNIKIRFISVSADLDKILYGNPFEFDLASEDVARASLYLVLC
ncbi:hypothetical protein D3C80_1083100 [compost metagenome]